MLRIDSPGQGSSPATAFVVGSALSPHHIIYSTREVGRNVCHCRSNGNDAGLTRLHRCLEKSMMMSRKGCATVMKKYG